MLNENQITDLLADYFISQNYSLINKCTTGQRGIDLTVRDPQDVTHYIEVKGETSSKNTSKRYGQAFDSKQIWNHVSVALMKTIKTEMETAPGSNKFGMAFPMNHEILVRKMLPILSKLEFSVYLVSKDEVKQLN